MSREPKLFRKPSGTYYAIFYDPGRHPVQRWHPLGTRDPDAAADKLRHLAALYTLGDFDPWEARSGPSEPPTAERKARTRTGVADAVAAFLDALRSNGRTPDTLRAYGGVLRLLVRAVGSDRPVSTLGAADVAKVAARPGLADKTRETYAVHLRAFAAWAVRERYLPAERLDAFKVRRAKSAPLPKDIRPAELAALVGEIEGDHARSPSVRETLRCAFLTAYDVGLRRRELCNLEWGHLDFDRGTLRLLVQKNGRQSVLPLADVALERLRARWEAHGRPVAGYVFPGPKGGRSQETYLSHAFKAYARAAGLRETVTLHSCRHGFGTMLAESGASEIVIMQALRHSDIKTSRAYIHFAGPRLAGYVNAAIAARDGTT